MTARPSFFILKICNLFRGEGVDFDFGAFREGGYLVADAGRLVTLEILCIYGVHRPEIGDIGQKDSGLHHIIETVAGLGEDMADIVEAAAGLRHDILRHSACSPVDRKLTGNEEYTIGLNGL